VYGVADFFHTCGGGCDVEVLGNAAFGYHVFNMNSAMGERHDVAVTDEYTFIMFL